MLGHPGDSSGWDAAVRPVLVFCHNVCCLLKQNVANIIFKNGKKSSIVLILDSTWQQAICVTEI